ncbi:MAG: hypothetical protein IH987_04300 [Planctomycetes bacterium]|nr:hypothetical protein [Planctomycetota bacterium]
MISHKAITCLGTLLLIFATEKNQAETPRQHDAPQLELAAADARREMEFGQRDRARADMEDQADEEALTPKRKIDRLFKEGMELYDRAAGTNSEGDATRAFNFFMEISLDSNATPAQVSRANRLRDKAEQLMRVIQRRARRDHEMEVRQWERAQERAQARARAEMEARVADDRRNLERETYELERELIEQRMREVELQAAAETLELEGKHNETVALQRELVHIRAELERRELQLELRRSDIDRQTERHDMLRMRDRLEYVSDWRGVAFDPQEAVMMATQAVVESAFAGGGSERASELLEGLLGEIRDVGSRTAIRFALRDLYGESGQSYAATEHLKQIILENARGLTEDHDGDRR